MDNSQQIKILEDRAQEYKSLKNESVLLEEKINSLKSKLSDIESRAQGVKGYEKMISEIDNEIFKFKGLNEATTEKLNDYSSEIKSTRIKKIVEFLKKIHENFKDKVKNGLVVNERQSLKGLHIIALLLLQFCLSFVTYLLTSNEKIIFYGSFFFLVNVVLFLFLNIFKSKTLNENLKASFSDINEDSFEYILKQVRNKKEDSLIINIAWVNALRKEKSKVLDSLNALITREGVSVLDELDTTRDEIKKTQDELDSVSSRVMPADQYLALRRELDLLKMQR